MRGAIVALLALLALAPAAQACDCMWAQPELMLHPPDCLPACDLERMDIPATLRLTWYADTANPFPEPHYDPDAEWRVEISPSTATDADIAVSPSQVHIQASQDGIENVGVAPGGGDPQVYVVTEKQLDLRVEGLQDALAEDGFLRVYLRLAATPDTVGTPVTQDPYTAIAVTVLEMTHKDGVTAWGHVPLTDAMAADDAPAQTVPGFAAPVLLGALAVALLARRSLGL